MMPWKKEATTKRKQMQLLNYEIQKFSLAIFLVLYTDALRQITCVDRAASRHVAMTCGQTTCKVFTTVQAKILKELR